MKRKYIQEGRGIYKLDKNGEPVWQYNMARIAEATEEVAVLNGDRAAIKRREAKRIR